MTSYSAKIREHTTLVSFCTQDLNNQAQNMYLAEPSPLHSGKQKSIHVWNKTLDSSGSLMTIYKAKMARHIYSVQLCQLCALEVIKRGVKCVRHLCHISDSKKVNRELAVPWQQTRSSGFPRLAEVREGKLQVFTETKQIQKKQNK